MSLIPFPGFPAPAEIEWRLRQPTQVNRSEFTSRRKVTVLAAAPRWRAKVTLPPIIGESRVLAWRAFLALCQGQAHWFNLVAVESVQLASSSVVVNGAGQTGSTLQVRGLTPNTTQLRAGHFATVNDQLLQLVADAPANGAGIATLSFRPYLRVSPVGGVPVVVDRPYARMSMSEDEAGWTVGRGQQYAIGFACEESF